MTQACLITYTACRHSNVRAIALAFGNIQVRVFSLKEHLSVATDMILW